MDAQKSKPEGRRRQRRRARLHHSPTSCCPRHTSVAITASASASASASALFVSLRLQASKGSKDPVCCSSSSSSSSSSLEPHSDRVRASGLLHGGDGFPPSRACFHVSKQAREQACVEPSREPSAVESLSFRRDALISRRTSCRMYAPRFQANLKLSNCAPGTARFGFAAALPAWASCLVG